MPMLRLSDDAMRLIRQETLPGYHPHRAATRLDDGSWLVPVDDAVAMAIARMRVTEAALRLVVQHRFVVAVTVAQHRPL